MISKQTKQETISAFGQSPQDTGSTEVQIALLTRRIEDLSEHFKVHTKDHHSRRGLLTYLRRNGPDQYQALIQRLGLRR